MAAFGCSRATASWETLWQLQSNTEPLQRNATFGLSWDNEERTRGEYGFTVSATAPPQEDSPDSWEISGSFTAEHVTPDYCGRAKWSAGSECFSLTLRPDGDSPTRELQERLDEVGLPDARVRTYLMYVDGKTKSMSLVRKAPGATETLWRHVPGQ